MPNILTDNLEVVPYANLPREMGNSLDHDQKECLAFGVKKLKVVGEPRIQTFQLGAHIQGKGTTYGGGLGTSLGANWGIFGSIGTLNLHQSATNTFRTDIQLRLEDTEGKKTFFEKSLPFPVTISVSQGDELAVYSIRGGLPHPVSPDFKLDAWTPFFVENVATGQIIPLSPLPSVYIPWQGNQSLGWLALSTVGGFFGLLSLLAIKASFSEGDIPAELVSIAVCAICFFPFYFLHLRKKRWEKGVAEEYRLAKERVAKIHAETKKADFYSARKP